MAKSSKLTLVRPNGPDERQIAKWALHPKIRMRLSAALRRPIFPNQVYISGSGKYVHIILVPASKFDKQSFRMKDLGHRGTRGIIGCPKGQWDPVTNSCRIGTRLQAVLIPKPRVTELGRKLATLSMPKRRRKRVMNENPAAVSYEMNPLLMTVTNPGFESNPVDVEYEPGSQMFRVHRTNPGTGYHQNPLRNPLNIKEASEISSRGSGFSMAADLDAANGNLHDALKNLGRAEEDLYISRKYQENPPRRHRGDDDDEMGEFGYGYCTACNGPMVYLGALGNRIQLRCRNCGLDASRERRDDDPTQFENNGGRTSYCPNPSFCENGGHKHDRFAVGDYVKNKVRIEVGNEIHLEKGRTGIVEKVGKFMGETSYEVVFETPRGRRTFRLFERELELSGKRWNDNAPPHWKPNRVPVEGRRTVRGTGRGGEYFNRKGEVTALHKEPSQRRGGVMGKSSIKGRKIPIEKFAAWLRKNGTPDEWRRFMKEVKAYKRFHKGAEPKFVTRKFVDVGAGKKIVARSFGYSMGKSPFEPYITPSGSGKGNKTPYLHEYETLPDGITNSTGKVVIKPLEGRTKITDWIHY